MSGHKVRATVSFWPTDGGGLTVGLPPRTRSVLLEFDEGESRIQLGAHIETESGDSLEPGSSDVKVIVDFWADEAWIHRSLAATLTLWSGRRIGEGTVDALADWFGADPDV